eukprot:3094843-Pyramimonas_sp.AAC.1
MLESLVNVNDRIKNDTIAFVRRMANGGLEDPLPDELAPVGYVPNGAQSGVRLEVAPPSASELLVRRVHAATAGAARVLASSVSRMQFIPGVQTRASKR